MTPSDSRRSGALHGAPAERGFTLVELMVAMTLGLLVAAAAVAALLIGRQGFTSVDSSSQLRETGRYAANAIELAAVEAGFQNEAYGVVTTSRPPGVRGYTNSLVSPALASLPAGLAHNTRNASNCGAATGTACSNGSDVLVVNFWGASRNGVADGTMIDCAGFKKAQGSTPDAYSILHVATGSAGEVNAEPALACSYQVSAGAAFQTVPIVQGVESFRVLYGTYGVAAGACSGPPSADTSANLGETPADTYLTAAQMDSAGAYCANNWARVRSLRIGLLLRGPVGSAPQPAAVTWNLLGALHDSYFNSPNDAWATLRTAADGRLRQQLVFTVHLRNSQN